MSKILFIGSYLSKSTGTKDIAEKISYPLLQEGITIKLISRKRNKLLRIFGIVLNIIFSKQKIVHFDVFSGNAFIITEIGSLLAKLRGKRILFTLRGGALVEFAKRYPERIRKVLTRANYIQSPSLFLITFFSEKNIHVNYLPNPIDLSKFPFKINADNQYAILWVRAFSEIYNPDLALYILSDIKKTIPTASLTMIGSNKGLLESSKELAKNLGIESSVNFIGPVANDYLFHYFQKHDVFINTTSYESFGTAVLEAAACGIPIVSSKVGEIPYVWTDEENILMIDELKPDLFADAVIRIFESPELAQQLSVNARKKAEEFDWERIKPKWIQLLREFDEK